MFTYKQKSLTTLFAVSALFGWMHIEGKPTTHTPTTFAEVLHENVPISHFMEGWDKPLLKYTLDDKTRLCKDDRECNKLAEAVVYEARNDTLFGQYAVASVILNRVDDPKRWPHTIHGVIHQGNGMQFEYLRNMDRQRTPRQQDWDVARMVAFDLLNGIMERVTDANHYYNPKTVRRKPRWAKVYDYVASTNHHDFHRWN